MVLRDLFLTTVVLEGGPAVTKPEVIERLLTHLAEDGHVPPALLPVLCEAVLRRERLGSTGIGQGVAIPHAKHPVVVRPLGVLAVCRAPVEFDALDGEPVDIVALLLTPPDRPGEHLGTRMRGGEGVVRFLADAGFRQCLRDAGSAERIREVLAREGRT